MYTNRIGIRIIGGAILASMALVQTEAQIGPVAEAPLTARLSPDGALIAFVAGDSIFVSAPGGASARGIAGGVRFEAIAGRKQLVWSPDSRFLLFRRGEAPRMNYVVVEVATTEIASVIPDSLEGMLRTVGNIFTGPPTWSPGSNQIAFLGTHPGEFGDLSVVYVAARDAQGRWVLRRVASDTVELTAVGWSTGHLTWASRARDGRATVNVTRIFEDSLGAAALIDAGRGRVTALVPNSDGSTFIATRAGAAPLLVAVRGTPRALPADLRREAGLDAYVGWLPDGRLLVFRAPDTWTSELVVIDAATGDVGQTIAKGGLLSDASMARTKGGVQVVFAEEDGSQPRSYRLATIAPDTTVTAARPVMPSRFAPGAEPWSTRIVTWRSRDGTVLQGQLLVPPARVGSLPPTVIVPYGGYRNSALTRTYFVDVLLRQLLDAGWQVIRPNTSAAAVLQQKSSYGTVQLADTRDLVSTLAAEGVLDPSRVAVLGHSHGATLAYYYATHSTSFCAVVAVNGRADWVMQARHEGDGLFPGALGASPGDDPALYAAASPLPNAHRVTAPMLLVAGRNDGQILPVNAIAMADSLKAHSRKVELLLFEDEGHRIESAVNRAELGRRVVATLASCR